MEQNTFIKILKKEMIPALGCTDPAGVAYVAAYAKKYAKGRIQSIHAELSVNIIKNAAAVCIPRTGGKCGVGLAVALGVVGGNPDNGLKVLSGITQEDVINAEELIDKGLVSIRVSQNSKKLYMCITVTTEETKAAVTAEDSYTGITSVVVNNETVYSKINNEGYDTKDVISYDVLSLKSILEFADTVPIEELGIIEDAIRLNMAVAEEGFANDYGVSAGKSIKNYIETGKMSDDYANIAMMWTAAATDARMAGCDIPVISNTGSGNQGLASTIPVISIARKMGVSYEKTVRAVTISSLVTIYIKEKLGMLSAVCGAIIAGTGTSCGVVYLLGGDEDNMAAALQSTLGNVAGMLCDGAKAGCSLKVATCTNTGVMAALFAMDNNGIKGTDGIVGNGEKETIDNFIKVATDGMHKMDNVILDIILKKEDINV